jgi:steroid delta-isomerase-like uncharacterized protein
MNRRQAFALATLGTVSAAVLHAKTSAIPDDLIEHTDLAAKNSAIIRRHHEVMNTGDVKTSVQYFAEDTKNHGVPVGRAGVLHVLTDIYGTFPDWRMEIEDLAAIGEDVVVRMTVTGTHKGVGKIPVNGGLLVGVPPTGKSFKVQHIHWYTMKDGLIVEHRANRDDVGMMQELGLLPAVKRYDLPSK